jgi:hypothetical protein
MSDFNFGTARPIATQEWISFRRALTIGVPIRVSEDLDASRFITSFIISNFSNNPASVFISPDQGMRSAIEIPVGSAPTFTIFQEARQLYELQILVMKITGQQSTDLIKIPVISWDLTNLWLEMSSPTPFSITVAAFPLPYL